MGIIIARTTGLIMGAISVAIYLGVVGAYIEQTEEQV